MAACQRKAETLLDLAAVEPRSIPSPLSRLVPIQDIQQWPTASVSFASPRVKLTSGQADQPSEYSDSQSIQKSFRHSVISSFSATALICANTRWSGFKPRLASDFLVMLATSGAPISNSTSTED